MHDILLHSEVSFLGSRRVTGRGQRCWEVSAHMREILAPYFS